MVVVGGGGWGGEEVSLALFRLLFGVGGSCIDWSVDGIVRSGMIW